MIHFWKPFREKFMALSSIVPLSIISKRFLLICNLLGREVPQKKKHFLGVFSTENWYNLNERKTLHKIFDCLACLKSWKWKDALAVFPTKSLNNKKKKAKQNGLTEPSILKDRTKRIFNRLNQESRTEYNTTFTKQAKDYLKVHKPSAKDIANQLEDACVERYVDSAIIVIGVFVKFPY